MDKLYIWTRSKGEVFKRPVKKSFERGVPTEVPAIFEDFFDRDPQFIEVSETEGLKILKTLKECDSLEARVKAKDKILKSLKKDIEDKMNDWKSKRDMARKGIKQPITEKKASRKKPKDKEKKKNKKWRRNKW